MRFMLLQRIRRSKLDLSWAHLGMRSGHFFVKAHVFGIEMKKTVVSLLLMVLTGMLSACGLNNVRKLNSDASIDPDRSIIVYGINVEGKWDAPMFSVNLDEYDLKSQAITGNCFRFNRTEAMVSSTSKGKHFFAFEVRPGHFVLSPFSNTNQSLSTTAFSAPRGKVVYIGTYVYDNNRILQLQRDLDLVANQLKNQFPRLEHSIAIAETVEVTRPNLFLCAP